MKNMMIMNARDAREYDDFQQGEYVMLHEIHLIYF